MRITLLDLSMRGLAPRKGFPVEMIIRGQRLGKTGRAQRRDRRKNEKDRRLRGRGYKLRPGQPEVRIFPDRNAAELRGVSMVSIGNTVGALIGGKKVGKFTEGGTVTISGCA